MKNSKPHTAKRAKTHTRTYTYTHTPVNQAQSKKGISYPINANTDT